MTDDRSTQFRRSLEVIQSLNLEGLDVDELAKRLAVLNKLRTIKSSGEVFTRAAACTRYCCIRHVEK